MSELKVPYYNKDYVAIKTSLLDTIKTSEALKTKWTDFSENDFGMVLLELFAGVADMTSFSIDNQVAEAFLDTVRKRKNVSRLAQMLGYSLKPRIAGVTKVSIVLIEPLSINYRILVGTKFKTAGTVSKVFSSKETFVIPSTQQEPRCCKFEIVTSNSSSPRVTDVALTGVDIDKNTSGAVLYAKIRKTGGKNKIALYKSSLRTGALDNSATDVHKVAYGEVNTGTYIIPITQVNNSGISGNIYIGSSDFSDTESVLEEFRIDGPLCYEGEDIVESFTSTGQPNQKFNTSYPIQKIPASTTKTKSVSVNSVAWTEVEDMFFEQNNYYKVESIEYTHSTIIFGDGDSGNIPPNGASINVSYVKGSGVKGHVGAGKIRGIITTLLNGSNLVRTQQYNIQSTTDAADEESVESAKINALNFFKNRSRAVTESDYVNLIKAYFEDGKYNPKLVQAYKDTTEPDLINEIELYVLSIDPTTGRYTNTNIDLTTTGGLWKYVDSIKTLPEGVRKSDGTPGIMLGTMDSSSAAFYYTVFKQSGYDRESIREEVREAIKKFFHVLEFQESIDLFILSKKILQVEGVQSVQIFTDSQRSQSAVNVNMSGHSNRGKVLVLPSGFYSVGEKIYVKIDGD
jgi:hypothetical protein